MAPNPSDGAPTGRLRNLVRNTARPGYARVMLTKAMRRFSPKERTRDDAIAWGRSVRTAPAEWAEAIDPTLWTEAKDFGVTLRERAARLREETGEAIGGGGRVEVLYFVTRLLAPETVVETGVAAGYSSATFLAAMERNGHGRLFSSDFPYFRDDEPERRIGVLVPEEQRADWRLFVAGDERNLPQILAEVDQIDLFHYDSDKSYAGRRRGIDMVTPHLAPGAAVLMDDIQDNVFFRDYVRARDEPFVVLGGDRAWVGGVGLPA